MGVADGKFEQPTAAMVAELARLRNITLSCDQQFGDFLRYCMKECGVPEDHVLDVNTWTFIPKPQLPKVVNIGETKKKGE